MGKLGGILLLAAVVGLTACNGEAVEGAPESSPSASESVNASPEITAPTETATPTPTPTITLPPEFYDNSARGKYLAGVKKALNAWRDGVVPSDEELLKDAEAACGLFAKGKTYVEIGALAGNDDIKRSNGVAVAVYASRFLCTKYNTDNL